MRDDEIVKEVKLDWLDITIISFLICFFVWLLAGCGTLPPAEQPGPNNSKLINFCDEQKDEFNNTLYSYCIRKIVDGKRKEILYFNAGAMDNNDPWTLDWIKNMAGMAGSPVKMKEFWDLWGDDAPTMIVVSFGRMFLTTSYPNRWMNPKLANTEYFTKTIMPFLEEKFNLKDRPRWVGGISQGSHNTWQLVASNPTLWKKAFMLNPLFPKPACDPFALIGGMTCMEPTYRVAGTSFFITQNYTRTDWLSYGSYAIVDKVDPLLLPKLMFQCDENDPYGFTYGTQRICSLLQLKNVNVQCVYTPGNNHIIWRPKDIVEWLKQ